MVEALEQANSQPDVNVYFNEVAYIDQSCLEVLVNWNQQHMTAGKTSVLHWKSLQGIFQNYASSWQALSVAFLQRTDQH